jgi:hypothetical protein
MPGCRKNFPALALVALTLTVATAIPAAAASPPLYWAARQVHTSHFNSCLSFAKKVMFDLHLTDIHQSQSDVAGRTANTHSAITCVGNGSGMTAVSWSPATTMSRLNSATPSSHEVRTVQQQGWKGLRNGELLRRAADAGFEVFITADQNLEFQQNLARSPLGIVVLVAPSNALEDLLPAPSAAHRDSAESPRPGGPRRGFDRLQASVMKAGRHRLPLKAERRPPDARDFLSDRPRDLPSAGG